MDRRDEARQTPDPTSTTGPWQALSLLPPPARPLADTAALWSVLPPLDYNSHLINHVALDGDSL